MAQRGGPAVLPDNPFQDPAVVQHRPGPESAALDAYNPFENGAPPPPPYHAPAGAPPAVGVPPPQGTAQPPRRPSPTEPRNYGSYGTQASAAAATAELLKRQEELNRKAEELDRRERELQNAALSSGATRLNNWPPLPSFCPVKPCFYQDIPVEIPADFQKTVSTMYYLWMASTIALFLNFLSSLAWFCVDPSSGSGFGLSILWALLYTPCSFVCWYRPMYKAFRSDSSFNFFVFFFVFFAQNVMYVLQAIGIPNWGFSSSCVGHHYAEEDSLSVPPDGCQLPEGTGGVCRRGLFQPGSAHSGGQRCCGCGHQRLPGTLAGWGPWLVPHTWAVW
ncbi:secretory carrier-associated membrane protein 3 isoform 3-T3 [Mergus octosetaceus]